MKAKYVINQINEVRCLAAIVKEELSLTEHYCNAVEDKAMGIDSQVDLTEDDLRKLNELVSKPCTSLTMALSRIKAADRECGILLNSLAKGVEDYCSYQEEEEEEEE